jgi:DNA-binding transcriptional regulator PaaX
MAGIDNATDVELNRSNANQTFAWLIEKIMNHKYPIYRINRAVHRLRERKLIKMIRAQNGWRYELTEKGQIALIKYEIKQKPVPKQKHWDKKWRIVIFDVREKRKMHRNAIRGLLISLGFKLLNKSVWIFPYPCDDIVELAKTAYGVRHDATYLVCNRFNGDEWLAFDFNLGLAPVA